jgi:hypothetical protein
MKCCHSSMAYVVIDEWQANDRTGAQITWGRAHTELPEGGFFRGVQWDDNPPTGTHSTGSIREKGVKPRAGDWEFKLG